MLGRDGGLLFCSHAVTSQCCLPIYQPNPTSPPAPPESNVRSNAEPTSSRRASLVVEAVNSSMSASERDVGALYKLRGTSERISLEPVQCLTAGSAMGGKAPFSSMHQSVKDACRQAKSYLGGHCGWNDLLDPGGVHRIGQRLHDMPTMTNTK
jgi:hypothetical protein